MHSPEARAARRRQTQSGLLIALAILGVSLLGLAPLAIGVLQRDAATLSAPSVTVEVVADGMRFVPDEIRVPAGASVRVDFRNIDGGGPHDFQTTRQYRDVRTVLWPGEQRSSVFIASDTPGRYAFICTVRGHAEAGMTGTIIVEPRAADAGTAGGRTAGDSGSTRAP